MPLCIYNLYHINSCYILTQITCTLYCLLANVSFNWMGLHCGLKCGHGLQDDKRKKSSFQLHVQTREFLCHQVLQFHHRSHLLSADSISTTRHPWQLIHKCSPRFQTCTFFSFMRSETVFILSRVTVQNGKLSSSHSQCSCIIINNAWRITVSYKGSLNINKAHVL